MQTEKFIKLLRVEVTRCERVQVNGCAADVELALTALAYWYILAAYCSWQSVLAQAEA